MAKWIAAVLPTFVYGHGTIVSPRSRNSVDYLVGVNSPKGAQRACTLRAVR